MSEVYPQANGWHEAGPRRCGVVRRIASAATAFALLITGSIVPAMVQSKAPVSPAIEASPALPNITEVIVTVPGHETADVDQVIATDTYVMAMLAQTLDTAPGRVTGVVIASATRESLGDTTDGECGVEWVQQYLSQFPAGDNEVRHIVWPGEVCAHDRAAAYAMGSNVIASDAKYAGAWDTTTHELGHTLGYGHQGSLVNGGRLTLAQSGGTDISELLQHGEYSFARSKDEAVNQYSGALSVMGDGGAHAKCALEDACSLFDTGQLNKIRPDVYPIATVDASNPETQYYTIAIDKNQLRGVWILLPDDHPLRQIPGGETIDSVVIGIGKSPYGHFQPHMEMLATNFHDSRQISYEMQIASILPAIDKGRGWVPVYTDKKTGVQVWALSSDGRNITLRVVSTKSKVFPSPCDASPVKKSARC